MKMTYFEDFAIGDVIYLGEKAVSHDEIGSFAGEFSLSPIHLDDAAARAALGVERAGDVGGGKFFPLDGVIASNWHVGSMFMRAFYDGLLATSSSRGAPGCEVLSWPSPVRANDRLRFELTVADIKPSRSRPDMGLVKFLASGTNQRAEAIFICTSWTMFGRREPADVV